MSHTYLPIWASYHRGPTLEPWASAVGQDLTDFMGDVVKTCYNIPKFTNFMGLNHQKGVSFILVLTMF